LQYLVSAVIVVFFGLVFLSKLSEPTYSDYANYENISFTVRGENDELLVKTERAFNNKDFTEAIQYFDQILENDPDNAEIQLYKAISLIEIDQFSKADEILGSLSQKTTAYKYKAIWYWALSKLKQNDDEECKNILNQIPEEADEYEQANKLLRKL
jgi:thioredoxin-like negative regulator of GroEL